MRYLAALFLFVFSSLHGQGFQESTQNFFLHIDYAHRALKSAEESPREDVKEREMKFFKHHLKKALKLQKKLSKALPYEELSASDRLFALNSFGVWERIIKRELDSPSFSRFSSDMINFPLQRERFEKITASLEPRVPLYTYPALIAADGLYFGVQSLKRYGEAEGDTNMPAKVRRKARAKAKRIVADLNKSAAALAESFPMEHSDNITDIVLERYAETAPFPKKGPFNEERLREAEYLLRKLQKAFYLEAVLRP